MIDYIVMNEAHAPHVAQLEARCFHDPWDLDSILYECKNPLSLWFVAVEDNSVVGYVGSQSVMGEADMMNLAVEPSYRRNGIAQALVEHLIQALEERKVHSLALEVRVSNEPAKALYAKLGFRQVGLRKNYYRNPKEDAMILRKEWAN